jgi:hypothetical protein
MALYVSKDVNETLDYVFARRVGETLTGVTYEVSPTSTVVVESCSINTTALFDEQGNEYPAESLVILWVSGGVAGGISEVRISYSTSGGRILDETIIFRMVSDS